MYYSESIAVTNLMNDSRFNDYDKLYELRQYRFEEWFFSVEPPRNDIYDFFSLEVDRAILFLHIEICFC